MNCEMCGKNSELLFKTIIEGTELSLCKKCSGHGRIIAPVKKTVFMTKQTAKAEPQKEIVEAVVSDYAQKIRKARENMGLNQQDFAKRITEKESIVSKIETGQFVPSIETAKKLEKILRIKLVEIREEETEKIEGKKDKLAGLTIGDLLKIK